MTSLSLPPAWNWRYALGKSLSNLGNATLASPIMPLTRIVPVGLSYPYDIRRILGGQSVQTIFDVGANIGQTSSFLQRHFPQADIWAFEPFSPAFEILKAKSQPFPRIHPQPYALGASAEILERPLRANSELNTLVESSCRADEATLGMETIQVQTLDQFGLDHNLATIDLLKLDVQGYELAVLAGADRYLSQNRIKFIYSEISFEEDNAECAYFETVRRSLEAYDFQFSGFYEFFRWGDNKRYFGFCNALFVHRDL